MVKRVFGRDSILRIIGNLPHVDTANPNQEWRSESFHTRENGTSKFSTRYRSLHSVVTDGESTAPTWLGEEPVMSSFLRICRLARTSESRVFEGWNSRTWYSHACVQSYNICFHCRTRYSVRSIKSTTKRYK